ncbi:MAG: beta-N-acetylhexosaminidase [Bacilli bacterium]|nr:beta-N-acetylhexosaminidase [Bacilli bacterium]
MKPNVSEAIKFLGLEVFKNLELKYTPVEDKSFLLIERNNNRIKIKYGELCALFRGLTYVKENSDNKQYKKEFHRQFTSNCWMIDVSRNATMKISEVKKIILMMSLFGMNRLMLYTEDTYEMKKYPYFGYLRGRYTKKDIQELVNYGEGLGVELVPCIETLDHLGRVLRWDTFSDIVDGPTNVMVDNSETYKFIEEMIKTCKEAYKSKYIHLGMDECWQLGLGKYKNKHGLPKDRAALFNEHLKKVIEICHKYDLEPIIWGDMYFRLVNVTGDYYSDKQLTDEIKKMIPKDVTLIYWDYYHEHKETYDLMVEKYLDLDNPVYFAGGFWNWASFSPLTKLSLRRSKLALESMISHQVKDVMMTTWGDCGAECSNFTALPVLCEFSCFDYLGEYDEEYIKSLLNSVSGEKLENMCLLDCPNEVGKEATETNCGRFYFYQDPLLGLFDKYVKDGYAKRYESYLPKLKQAQEESRDFKYIYENMYDLVNVLKNKVDLGVRLRNAYQNKNMQVLQEIKDKELPLIQELLEKFSSSFYERWHMENKGFGYEVMDGRIGFVKNRIQTTQKLLTKYLNKEIDQIDELEEDILPYSEEIDEKDLFIFKWELLVTPSEI